MDRERALNLIAMSCNMMGLYHTTKKRFACSDAEIEIDEQLQTDYLTLLEYCERHLT